jgi:hypothetical protein
MPSDYPLFSDNRKEFAWIIQQITQAVTSFSFACGFSLRSQQLLDRRGNRSGAVAPQVR